MKKCTHILVFILGFISSEKLFAQGTGSQPNNFSNAGYHMGTPVEIPCDSWPCGSNPTCSNPYPATTFPLDPPVVGPDGTKYCSVTYQQVHYFSRSGGRCYVEFVDYTAYGVCDPDPQPEPPAIDPSTLGRPFKKIVYPRGKELVPVDCSTVPCNYEEPIPNIYTCDDTTITTPISPIDIRYDGVRYCYYQMFFISHYYRYGNKCYVMYEIQIFYYPCPGYVVPYKMDDAEGSSNSMNKELALYPNPLKGNILNIEYEVLVKGNVQIEIFNSLGQRVFNSISPLEAGMHSEHIDLSHLASGIYTVKIAGEGVMQSKKLVIAE